MCMQTAFIFRLLFCMCLSFLYSCRAAAQNLVPNPSFEDYNGCPANGLAPHYPQIVQSPAYSSFPAVKAWVSPTINGSPDYYNGCAPMNAFTNVPNAIFGYQQARTGQAYMGMYICYQYSNGGSDYREYIGCKLKNPLIAGNKYLVSFHISSSSGFSSGYNYVATDQLGVKLSKSKIDSPKNIRGINPQLINPTGNYLIDSINWMLVAGTFVATGGEEWLTIGNFTYSLPPPTRILVYPAVEDPSKMLMQYVYIDDVCVLDLSHPAQRYTMLCVAAFPATIKALSQGTYKWNTGDTTDTITIQANGKYWCEVIGDCSYNVDTIVVTNRENYQLNIGPDTSFCSGKSIVITANSLFDTYHWNTGATTPTITLTKAGEYILTVTNSCGQYSDSINLKAIDVFPPEGSDTAICINTYPLWTNVKGTDVRWYADHDSAISYAHPPINMTIPGKRTFYVTQTLTGCESPGVPVTIEVKRAPENHTGNDTTLCRDNPAQIGTQIAGITYTWNTGETGCCIIPAKQGMYIREAHNECGTTPDSITIDIQECEDCMFVPTAFSPNGDGLNDLFGGIPKCPLMHYYLQVFNRWGERIFVSGAPEKKWDGTYKNISAEVGVFHYSLEYIANTSVQRKLLLKGDITLIK